MNPRAVIAAASQVLLLESVRAHLRIDGGDLDDVIEDAIASAEAEFERKTGRCLLTTTWEYSLDKWPSGDCIRLPKGQIQSVESITYCTAAGAEITWPTTEYEVDAAEGEIELAVGKLWPPAALRAASPILIQYIAGWTDPLTVPADIKRALRLHVEYQVDGPRSGGVTALHEMERAQSIFDSVCLEYRVEVD